MAMLPGCATGARFRCEQCGSPSMSASRDKVLADRVMVRAMRTILGLLFPLPSLPEKMATKPAVTAAAGGKQP